MDQDFHARLLKALHYDPDTGEFRWLQSRMRGLANAQAGCVMKRRNRAYLDITFEQKIYKAHRLAWFYVTGSWPKHQIDHIDGNSLNNRLSNLREATNAQNVRNRGRQHHNKSGYKGVQWLPAISKWQATIGYEGRNRYLGCFNTAEEAYQAYCKAATEWHAEFARLD